MNKIPLHPVVGFGQIKFQFLILLFNGVKNLMHDKVVICNVSSFDEGTLTRTYLILMVLVLLYILLIFLVLMAIEWKNFVSPSLSFSHTFLDFCLHMSFQSVFTQNQGKKDRPIRVSFGLHLHVMFFFPTAFLFWLHLN